MSAQRFRLNTPRVVHERFDDEWVLVNFESGTYYSVGTLGAEIVGLLETGHDMSTVSVIVSSRYLGDAGVIERAVRDLVDRLVAERLLIPGDGANIPGEAGAPVVPVPIPADARVPFVAPTVEKFTDMQDLLLLDPIHDVDESGWPVHRPAAAPDGSSR